MEQYIEESIKSALAQTFQNFEIIILDNCSSDRSWQIIQRFDDPRIKAFRQAVNVGMYANLNTGIMLARGIFTKILCADDLLHPKCLEILDGVRMRFRHIEDAFIYLGHKKTVLRVEGTDSQAWLSRIVGLEPPCSVKSLRDGIQCGLPEVCFSTQAFLEFGAFGNADPEKDFSRDMLRLGIFSLGCQVVEISEELVLERAHSLQNRFHMPKRWQLNEVYDLYRTAGLIDDPQIKREVSSLAGRHLLSGFKYLWIRRSPAFLWHTILFSVRNGLVRSGFFSAFFSSLRLAIGDRFKK